MDAIVCPVCERGTLSRSVVVERLPYAGAELLVPEVEVSVCSECEEQLVLPEQAKRNDRRFADARRRHDGLLTSGEIVRWRRAWGLTQAAASALLGGGANAFSKYERGEILQSRAMDLLIRVTDESKEAREFLSARAGVSFNDFEWRNATSGSSSVVDLASYRVKQVRDVAAVDGWKTMDAAHAH